MAFLRVYTENPFYSSFKDFQGSLLAAGVLFLEGVGDSDGLPLLAFHTKDKVKWKAEEKNRLVQKLKNTEYLGKYLERVVLNRHVQIRDQSCYQALILDVWCWRIYLYSIKFS